MMFSDTYLRKLGGAEVEKLHTLQRKWRYSPEDFEVLLDNWVANFEVEDKALALRILNLINYFNDEEFRDALRRRWKRVLQYLHEINRTQRDLILVVPDQRGDSADRHSYEALKTFGLEQDQIVEIPELGNVNLSEKALLFVNDTHGTGNQFIRDFISNGLVAREPLAMFIIGVAIGNKAHRRFKSELRGVNVYPDEPEPSAWDLLSWTDCERIRRIGRKVYPSHPMGYGDAALLTAYSFQCPNNSLPLIWADGHNNLIDKRAFEWTPLFPYKPKTKPLMPEVTLKRKDVPAELLRNGLPWVLTEVEFDALIESLEEKNLRTNTFCTKLLAWFNNFEEHEKSLAIELFQGLSYWDLQRTRAGIGDLWEQIIVQTKRDGGDHEDIMLVTTGHDQKSVYHYVYDFMTVMGLETRQVCDYPKLTPDKAIDKTLVFFYHSRPTADEFLRPRGRASSYFKTAQLSKPRRIMVCSFAMSPEAIESLQAASREAEIPVSVAMNAAASSTVNEKVTSKSIYEKILGKLGFPKQKRSVTDNLIAYYFQCPAMTSPLIWKRIESPKKNQRKWEPLFENKSTN